MHEKKIFPFLSNFSFHFIFTFPQKPHAVAHSHIIIFIRYCEKGHNDIDLLPKSYLRPRWRSVPFEENGSQPFRHRHNTITLSTMQQPVGMSDKQ